IDVYGISEVLKTEIDWSKAPYNWKLKFSTWPSKVLEGEAHLQICSWIQSGVLDPKDFVSHVFPLDDAQKAFDMVKEKPKGMRKIVIKISE
ncbi:MAG: sorbitol dehydrogenase, partial [Lachnospiraceae bacterium]|nr:sorbitol dehydrogenase [Lachnospiraceae bacterium]